MASRLPQSPPVLAGYTAVRPLGSGGFADVYLYEQGMPRREVAVKVLLTEVSSIDVREMFLSEATVMARLSAHPSAVTVYEANVSADGRPYLVMEYCPGSYGQRFRSERLPVHEVLQVAVAVGSVLETTHRGGVLHRDVKPANILITSYGRPVLADFGIAATVVRTEGQGAFGMSVPWSAPEVLAGETSGTVASEVWAFSATVYSLLAGRSPFELPGQRNTRDEVQRRILGRRSAPPIGRDDVPSALEELLQSGLSKDPADRPESVLDVLRGVQLAETELGLRPSVLDVPSERVLLHQDARPDLLTRSVEDLERTGAAESLQLTGTASRTGRRIRSVPRDGTAMTASAIHTQGGADRRLRWRWVVPLIALGVAVAIGVLLLLGMRLGAPAGDGAIPQVGSIRTETAEGTVSFRWDDPGLVDGDSYQVRVTGDSGNIDLTTQSATNYTVSSENGRVCLTVTVLRGALSGQPSGSACAG